MRHFIIPKQEIIFCPGEMIVGESCTAYNNFPMPAKQKRKTFLDKKGLFLLKNRSNTVLFKGRKYPLFNRPNELVNLGFPFDFLPTSA